MPIYLNIERYKELHDDPKSNAQANLTGRSYYVTDSTLKYHHSRICETQVSHNGLIFSLIERVAKDWQNTARGYRYVTFDITGDVLNRPSNKDIVKTRREAAEAMELFLDALDAPAKTLVAIDRYSDHQDRVIAQLRTSVAQNRVHWELEERERATR